MNRYIFIARAHAVAGSEDEARALLQFDVSEAELVDVVDPQSDYDPCRDDS